MEETSIQETTDYLIKTFESSLAELGVLQRDQNQVGLAAPMEESIILNKMTIN